jgi:two-component system, chemotaxis family, protein-glutamate methylesterase/glutaminase
MAGHDIITIGASAGGVEAINAVTSALPEDLPAAVFVVLHMPATRPSQLAQILARSSRLSIAEAKDGEPIELGRVYVAPPDYHLILDNAAVRVVRSARENGHRPAVDPLFRTAARAYGPRVVGVVLSGTRDCGTVGLQQIKSRGGVAMVQEPEDAMFPDMPRNALNSVDIDHCLPVAKIPAVLTRLAHMPAGPPGPLLEPEIEEPETAFTCPECGGNLTSVQSGATLAFRCKVGHRYSPESLVGEQAQTLEAALWIALRTIEDATGLARRLAQRAKERKQARALAYFEERVRSGESQAKLVKKALASGLTPTSPEGVAPPADAAPDTGQ